MKSITSKTTIGLVALATLAGLVSGTLPDARAAAIAPTAPRSTALRPGFLYRAMAKEAGSTTGDDNHVAHSLVVDPSVWLKQRVTTRDYKKYAIRPFGYAVAISGTTAFIGAPFATTNGHVGQGVVQVFRKLDGTWTRTGELTPSDGHAEQSFGSSIVVSDGTLIVGAFPALYSISIFAPVQGSAYVFTESNGVWVQNAKLTPPGDVPPGDFGYSVAVSGNTALVGAPAAPVDGKAEAGAVYVYTGSGGSWTLVQKLVSNDPHLSAFFGKAIALSGTTALIGAPFLSSGAFQSTGAAYLFGESGATWVQVAKLSPKVPYTNELFGHAVALSGTTALVCAPKAQAPDASMQGEVFVFTKTSHGWATSQVLTADRDSKGPIFSYFGDSVALSGAKALVGIYQERGVKLFSDGYHSYYNSIREFTKLHGRWVQARKFVLPCKAINEGSFYIEKSCGYNGFGSSVAVSHGTLLAGAYFDDLFVPVRGGNVGYRGAAYFFSENDLDLAVSAPNAVTANRAYVNQVIVTNDGSVASAAVSASIAVPAAASFISANATQGSCNEAAAGIVTCNFGAVPGNGGMARGNITLRAPDNESAGNLRSKAALLHTLSPFPLSASMVTRMNLAPADLAVSGGIRPTGAVRKGENLTYLITVRNLPGASDGAIGARLGFVVPYGLDYLASNGAACMQSPVPDGAKTMVGAADTRNLALKAGSASVVCELGTLRPNQSKLVKLAVRATAAASSIAAVFKVSSRAPDSNTLNNTVMVKSVPRTGPPGPPGPAGAKGKGGGGGLGIAGIVLFVLCWLGAAVLRRRRAGSSWLGCSDRYRCAQNEHRSGREHFCFGSEFDLEEVAMNRLIAMSRLNRVVAVRGLGCLAVSAWLLGAPLAWSVVTPANAFTAKEALPPGSARAVNRLSVKASGKTRAIDKNGCASVPQQALTACFDKTGVYFLYGGKEKLGLRLLAYGRNGERTTVKRSPPKINGNVAKYFYGDLAESWRVLPAGFEQSFTVARRPAGAGELELVLSVAAGPDGVHAAASDRSSDRGTMAGRIAWGKLNYGKVAVTDARGRVVPAALRRKGDHILILINDANAVYPLTVDPFVWLKKQVVSASGAKDFGDSVFLSGNTALIGAPLTVVNGAPLVGAIYVFTKTNGTWTQTQEITPPVIAIPELFGVNLAGDSSRAITNCSAVPQLAACFYHDVDGVWTLEQRLIAPKTLGSTSTFAQYAQLDGNTAIIGAPAADPKKPGFAFLYTRSNGKWELTQTLKGSSGLFGQGVGLAGKTALVRKEAGTDVFTESNGIWSKVQTIENFEDYQTAGATTFDGQTAILGNSFSDYSFGFFGKRHGDWSLLQALKLPIPNKAIAFIQSAIHGSTALFGVNLIATGASGEAFLAIERKGSWKLAGKLTPDKRSAVGSSFGASVALGGNTMLIGAPNQATHGNRGQGVAYFFEKSNLDLAVRAPQTLRPGQQYSSQTIVTNSASASRRR